MLGYPIFNGDHAEFELKHANTPPRGRPDWPLPSFDARDWAASFQEAAIKLGYSGMDEGWLIAWFSCALMRGYDEACARAPELTLTEPQRGRT